ncbi:hypothetical protein HDU84_000530 [Entophlyctis sp. JEL0112]|nr:hypothetical protein HDU84_000530 [Entophlyctis sp. JEL0112]
MGARAEDSTTTTITTTSSGVTGTGTGTGTGTDSYGLQHPHHHMHQQQQQQQPYHHAHAPAPALDCVSADPAAQFNIMFAQMQQSLSFPPLPPPDLNHQQQYHHHHHNLHQQQQQQQQQQTQYSLPESQAQLPLFTTATAHQPGFGPPSPSASPGPAVRGTGVAHRRSKSTSDSPLTDEQVKRIKERERKKKREMSRGLTCSNCGTRETPLWRRTSDRMNMLCNACGEFLLSGVVMRLEGEHFVLLRRPRGAPGGGAGPPGPRPRRSEHAALRVDSEWNAPRTRRSSAAGTVRGIQTTAGRQRL